MIKDRGAVIETELEKYAWKYKKSFTRRKSRTLFFAQQF